MISSSGQVVWQARMEAFGEVSVSINQIDNPLRFPGQYHDVETGLYYNFHRYYAPKLGRYITSDPIGLAGGVNTYGYVGGKPIGLIDPLGLQANPLNVLRVTPWQIVLRVLTNPVGDGTLDAWRREHPGEELPTFPSNVDPNAVVSTDASEPDLPLAATSSDEIETCDETIINSCDLVFIRQVYWGGDTKSCLYKRKSVQFTFPQDADLPCMPIDINLCMIDTSFMGPRARAAYGK